jgi:FKBP-type peptidyl-prolyl cis-trans isomerase (trigger factor)
MQREETVLKNDPSAQLVKVEHAVRKLREELGPAIKENLESIIEISRDAQFQLWLIEQWAIERSPKTNDAEWSELMHQMTGALANLKSALGRFNNVTK